MKKLQKTCREIPNNSSVQSRQNLPIKPKGMEGKMEEAQENVSSLN